LGVERPMHPVLVDLFFHANKAERRTAERLGVELLAPSEPRNDRVLSVDGHRTPNACSKLGTLVAAQKHFEQGMWLDEEHPRPALLIERFDDPEPHLLVIGGCALWV
jgi:hypothetical protein